jgi:GR25 family glycosyltransferase involved in LPS biosynthesis
MNYQAYVITIMDNPKSVAAAKRCIKSAALYGLKVEMFAALTPKDDPETQFKIRGIPTGQFEEKYSRKVNCMAAFLSHFSLWERAVLDNVNTVIFEHDAFITGPVPVSAPMFKHYMTFSKPSYGEYNLPTNLGVNPLTQKRYFGGAHGYMVSPKGAWTLVEVAQRYARPTDIFLNIDTLPTIQEYYPWVCEARDNFSTIQNEVGVQMKHNYTPNKYELVNVK